MGIREQLNRKPGASAGAAAALIALAAIFLVLQLRAGSGGSDQAFFTVDDGETWFADDISKLPPFQRDGKEAVRAYVFECGGKKFVNHLERLTPEARKLMEATAEAQKAGKPPPPPPASAGRTVMWGQEFKKPGEKEWVPGANLAKVGPVLQPKCPDGGGNARLVEP